jgi:hypothetical protein
MMVEMVEDGRVHIIKLEFGVMQEFALHSCCYQVRLCCLIFL